MAQKNILIVCGEASGELHASILVRELKKINPGLSVYAVGSALLKEAGAEIIYGLKELSVIGLFDALRKLPKFFALKKFLLEKIKELKVDLVILVDFSGFNLRFAKALNKRIPAVYYISPQVWASRAGRIKSIKKYINKMIVLFKFEEAFYRKHSVEAVFVGHPLLDTVKPALEKREFFDNLGLAQNKITIALLPGSRRQEIKNILPLMLKSASLIVKELSAQFIIAKSAQVDLETYKKIINGFSLDLKIVEGKTYDCLGAADFCLVASGTATLETAIMQKPFCIIYKMSLLNYLLYRPQVKVPFIGIVNIIAGRKIIPEFVQFGADPKKIASHALSILKDPAQAQQIKKELAQIKDALGQPGASTRAAKIITQFLGEISNSAMP